MAGAGDSRSATERRIAASHHPALGRRPGVVREPLRLGAEVLEQLIDIALVVTPQPEREVHTVEVGGAELTCVEATRQHVESRVDGCGVVASKPLAELGAPDVVACHAAIPNMRREARGTTRLDGAYRRLTTVGLPPSGFAGRSTNQEPHGRIAE